jgi:hypothetical protein
VNFCCATAWPGATAASVVAAHKDAIHLTDVFIFRLPIANLTVASLIYLLVEHLGLQRPVAPDADYALRGRPE